MCLSKVLRTLVSNCSHCFMPLNCFSSLPWLNIMIALYVNWKWAFTAFILFMQLVKVHQLAVLNTALKMFHLTLKNTHSDFAVTPLSYLSLDAQLHLQLRWQQEHCMFFTNVTPFWSHLLHGRLENFCDFAYSFTTLLMFACGGIPLDFIICRAQRSFGRQKATPAAIVDVLGHAMLCSLA